MTKKSIIAALGAGFLLLSLPAHSAPLRAQDAAPIASGRQDARRPKAGTEREIARYRAREAASPAAKDYRGGDGVIVIGVSTVTVVLAVVLLVVLL